MPESITDKLAVKNLYLNNLGVADRQIITTTDLISEGPIHGLVDGSASIFLNDDRAVPLSQANTFHSATKATVSLTNNSTTATIVDGGSTPILEAENGDKYLIVRKGYGSVYVTASEGGAETTNGNISCTLTTDGSSSFFTDSMISSPADYDTFVPARLIALTDAHGETNEGHGEGYITKRTSASVCTFIPGAYAPAGLWIPEGDYHLEVDRIVKIASISGATLTLSSAWTGVTGSFKYDASGAIISNSDEVKQTEVANYQGVTTQFRIGSHSQVPFRGQNEFGSTSISNNPSAGGTLEQTQGYGSGSQAPKVLIASSSSGFNLTASQIQEVDEARFTIGYAGGFYAVSGAGNDKNTYAQYQFKIAIKKPGESDFEPYTFLENPKTHSGGAFKNSVSWVYKIDLDEYRPFIDFKVEVSRITNHTGPGYKKLVNGVAETFHDWQNVTQSSLTNTTCVIKDRLTHPYSAMAKVSFSTSQFTNMPTRSYHTRGLKIQVPSNYVTREENAGVSAYTRDISTGALTSTYQDWDGSFRRFPVYTNNPAWVFYDILTNDRYGLGEFLSSQDIDKYMLYRIARYCDELVPDGKGGEEPRFTANLYLTKRADAYKVIKDIATIFRGMVYYFDGQVSPVIDAPSGPVYTFTKANVLEGQFSYEGTGSKTRINQVIVTWTNPEASYKAEPLIVEDRKNIADTGQIISQSAVAMGAITEGQALRYGRWKLWTAANQKEIVSFTTSLNGSFLIPGDIINIQDSDRHSRRYGGRISNSGTTRSTTSIPLDSSVSLISGSTYTLSVLFEEPGAFATSDVTINGIAYKKGDLVTQAFIDGNGDGGASGNGTYTLQNIDSEVKAQNAKASATGTDALLLSWSDTHRAETKPVTQALVGTNTSTITVTQAFSAVPAAETIWVLTETSADDATVEGSAKQYKILSLNENSKNEYGITAVEHYDEKFSAIEEDFTTFIADTVYPAVRTTDVVPPVIDIHATNKPKKHGGVSEGEVTIKWTPPRNIGSIEGVYEHLVGYEIVHSFETIPSPIKITDPNQTSLFLNSIEDGKYRVSIRVINILNNVSAPVIALVSVSNKFKEPIPRLANGVPFCGTTSTGFSLSGNTFQFKKFDYTFKPPSDNAKSVTNTVSAVSAWQQDCSNLPNITWSESDRNIEGQFIVEHAYILFDSSDTTDRLKLLKYHKPTTIGTSFWYDAGTGNTTNKFGSALSGTFTKAVGSSKVTGSSTAFTTQIEEGDVLKLGSEEIGVAAVESDTILYLERASETAHSGVSGNIQNIRIDFINDVIIARVYKTSSGLVLAETYSKIDAVLKSVTDIANPVTASEMNVSDLGDIATDMTGVTLTNPTITGGNISGFAPLASPDFTGVPTAPTPSASTNSTQIATTEYADRAVSNLVDAAPSNLNTLNELAAALGDNVNFSTNVNAALGFRLVINASQSLSATEKTHGLTNLGIQNINNTSDANKPVSSAQQTALNLKANLASPTFTGTVGGISKSMVGLGSVDNLSQVL
jgi:predicted phage tail protein